MKRPRFENAGLLLVASLIAGCGGSQIQGAPGASSLGAQVLPNDGRLMQGSDGASWMAPDSKKQDLLYVSNRGYVSVYTYPGGKLVGALTGFNAVYGLCADKAGNVFVTDAPGRIFGQDGAEIVEYAHGGTGAINVLDDTGNRPFGCAVDPKTGNLAVTNFCASQGGGCSGGGNVAIFRKAKGAPTRYTDGSILQMWFCGYDPQGNLFVDGLIGYQYSEGVEVAELKNGSSTFTNILLDRVIYVPGGVQWDGKYLAIGDAGAGGKFAASIHQVQVTGSTGTVVGTTRLKGAGSVYQFWIQGSNVIAPSPQWANDVRFYPYPVGGSPTKIITGDLKNLWDATVSEAPR